MQKKLIALAIAGLSGAAFAQSNVTVYGVADVYYANIKATGFESVNQINSGGLSGSRLGFKGVEALGNGLSAVFTLEYGLAVDANAGVGASEVTAANTVATGTQARQQFLGLTGGFGTAVAGRLQTTGYDFSNGGYNPVAGSALDPHNEVTAGTLITAASRANNAVAYISPNFSGLTFAINHARLNETQIASGTANTDNNNATLASVTYENGPLKAGYVYSKNSDAGNVTTDFNKENALGISYDFKVVKLGAAWQDNKTKTVATATDVKNKSWLLSAAAPVGPGTLAFTYAKQDLQATTLDEKAWTLAYLYPMSKRTTAYGGYEKVSDHGNVAGASQKTFAVGLRHTF